MFQIINFIIYLCYACGRIFSTNNYRSMFYTVSNENLYELWHRGVDHAVVDSLFQKLRISNVKLPRTMSNIVFVANEMGKSHQLSFSPSHTTYYQIGHRNDSFVQPAVYHTTKHELSNMQSYFNLTLCQTYANLKKKKKTLNRCSRPLVSKLWYNYRHMNSINKMIICFNTFEFTYFCIDNNVYVSWTKTRSTNKI